MKGDPDEALNGAKAPGCVRAVEQGMPVSGRGVCQDVGTSPLRYKRYEAGDHEQGIGDSERMRKRYLIKAFQSGITAEEEETKRSTDQPCTGMPMAQSTVHYLRCVLAGFTGQRRQDEAGGTSLPGKRRPEDDW